MTRCPGRSARSSLLWVRADLAVMALPCDVSQHALARANELQVIRLIGNGPMAKGAYDLPVFQKEHARHLMSIFLDQADSILEQRALEPAHPDLEIEKVQIRVGARQAEEWKLIERGFRIADSFHIGKVVVVEVRLGPFRGAEMREDRAHAPGLNLRAHLRNAGEGLGAERAGKVAEKDEQH